MFNKSELRLPNLVFLAILLAPVSAHAKQEIENEVDSYNKFLALPQCKDPESKACQSVLLAHYCKFQGSSRNAVQCAGGKRTAAEARLNASYVRLLKGLRKNVDEVSAKTSSNLFIEAQRAWIVFREKECNLMAESFAGGTLQPAVYEDCMREAAERRIEDFGRIGRQFEIEQ